jgi:CheY-like chemotaxis protein
LRQRWPAVRAILYSGYVLDDVRERALALGAVAVLRKEDTATRLPEIMGRLARRKAEADR